MTRKIALAVPILFALALPAWAQPGSSAEELRQASEVQSRLVAWLGPDAQTIQVTAVGSRIFLTGVVEQRATRDLADEVALASPGVSSSRNRVQARQGDRHFLDWLRDEGRDTMLEIRVKHALQREGLEFARALEVEAVDGVVSLRGQLESADRKHLAVELAGKVEGVKKVLDLVSYVVSAKPAAG